MEEIMQVFKKLPKKLQLTIVLGCILISLLLIFGLLFVSTTSSENLEEEIITQTESLINEQNIQTYFVEITGYVNNPGVYELDQDIIVLELINKAGGLREDADLEFVHQQVSLSAFTKPNYKLFVPAKKDSSSNSTNSNSKVSLNNASLEELKTLPGVGDSIAQKIVSARPFIEISELTNVEGIGESTFSKLESLVVL